MATNTYDTNNAGYPSRTSRTHGFARAVRNILGALWLACSAVVLGIGAYFIKNVSGLHHLSISLFLSGSLLDKVLTSEPCSWS